MASLKQINANRANSLKSTGPKTPEGKSTTKFNSLKSGIYAQAEITPQESQSELTDLKDQFFDQFQPATPEEVSLLDTIIRNEWLLRRMAMVEAAFWNRRFAHFRDFGVPP